MDKYLSWNNKIITDFSDKNLNAMFENGYVFTRTAFGSMYQTRSLRVDLSKFELSSENRRILKKNEDIKMTVIALPHSDYDWQIHKLGFDFYANKFGKGIFTANKLKELMTSKNSNFNILLKYSQDNKPLGYCIGFQNNDWLHYAYPFYDLTADLPNLGLGMMTKAIVWAKENEKKYVCLGSAQNNKSIYKLQFKGIEWFDGKNWQNNTADLKKILTNIN